MTGFIVTAPVAETTEVAIVSGPFWPDVQPEVIRDEHRIDNTITPTRLRATLIEAIANTNYALRQFRDAQIEQGITTLADVDAEKIDGTSVLIHRYQRAVGCLAKALLLERMRDFDSTAKGDKKSDQSHEEIDDCRRDYMSAIADIAGRPRTTVELI